MEPTAVSLLERLRQSADAAAWARFVELFTPLLFDWARGVGLADADAADLVREVLADLARTLPSFTPEPNRGFRAWLRTLVRNEWRAVAARRAAGPVADDTADAPPADDEAFWEAHYRRRLTGRVLQLMQGEFPPTTWQAFWECAVAGRGAAEVGRQLGLEPGAVRGAEFRVLCRLRQELDGLLD